MHPSFQRGRPDLLKNVKKGKVHLSRRFVCLFACFSSIFARARFAPRDNPRKTRLCSFERRDFGSILRLASEMFWFSLRLSVGVFIGSGRGCSCFYGFQYEATCILTGGVVHSLTSQLKPSPTVTIIRYILSSSKMSTLLLDRRCPKLQKVFWDAAVLNLNCRARVRV